MVLIGSIVIAAIARVKAADRSIIEEYKLMMNTDEVNSYLLYTFSGGIDGK